jgi:hypothetical protein
MLKSKLCYDQRSVGQSVLVSSTHLELTNRLLSAADLLMWDALTGERTGLSFTLAAGPRQRGQPWVRVPPSPYFTFSYSRLPQPGGPGPRIYIPQEQGRPVILPGTGFWINSSQKSHCDWRSVNQQGLMSSPSLSQVRVSWDSWPYFTVSDLRLPFSSPPTTRRVTVEVSDPVYAWVSELILTHHKGDVLVRPPLLRCFATLWFIMRRYNTK